MVYFISANGYYESWYKNTYEVMTDLYHDYFGQSSFNYGTSEDRYSEIDLYVDADDTTGFQEIVDYWYSAEDVTGVYQEFYLAFPIADDYYYMSYADDYYTCYGSITYVNGESVSVCIEEYYADTYIVVEEDNGYYSVYYMDPHGLPEFGSEYDPLGYDEDSKYGAYQQYYEFTSPLYCEYYATDAEYYYEEGCTQTDGETSTCFSNYFDYSEYYISDDGQYESYVWIDADGVDYDTESYQYGSNYDAGKEGETYSETSLEPLVNEVYISYTDGYYNSYCDNIVGDCTSYYDDIYIDLSDENCEGSYYEDADHYYGYTDLDCSYTDMWSTYDTETGDVGTYNYYSETHDTYYHVTCYDEAKNVCDYQYDDYHDEGTIYYDAGVEYYWEVYAEPDEVTYFGKHVHTDDNGDYSVYYFSMPDNIGQTYYETNDMASSYNYYYGEYTEFLQDFYGEFAGDLFEWEATVYQADDSEVITEFDSTMDDDNKHLHAYYNELDELIVEVTTDGQEFYALYNVDSPVDAYIIDSSSFITDSGIDEFDGSYYTDSYYVDYNGDLIHSIYWSLNGQMRTYYQATIDGEDFEETYMWYDNLNEDSYSNAITGEISTNDYSNSYYYENGDYNSYYSIASDGSFVYYSDEFIGADGLIRETAG